MAATTDCFACDMSVGTYYLIECVLGIGDGEVLVDDKVIYEMKDLKVGLFDNPRAM